MARARLLMVRPRASVPTARLVVRAPMVRVASVTEVRTPLPQKVPKRYNKGLLALGLESA